MNARQSRSSVSMNPICVVLHPTPFPSTSGFQPRARNGSSLRTMEPCAANTNSSRARRSMLPSGVFVIFSGMPSCGVFIRCLNSSIPAYTRGSSTSPSISNMAGSPSSENRSLTMLTPCAKSEDSSRKSSTAKSPSRLDMAMLAGTVNSKASTAITIEFLNRPL